MAQKTTRCPMSKEGRTVERRNVEMAKKLERTAEMKGIKMELTIPYKITQCPMKTGIRMERMVDRMVERMVESP